MPAVASPYGLQPVTNESGYHGRRRAYSLTTNSATGFFTGDIVNIGAGVATPVGTTPTTTRNGYSPWGIFVGCEYDSALSGRQFSPTLPANAITGGATNVLIFVETDPDVIMQVQGSAAIAYTDIGKNAALANFGGSTTSGLSTMHLLASSINTTNTLAVKIIDFVSPTTDTYPDVLVIWNQNVHAWKNILGV